MTRLAYSFDALDAAMEAAGIDVLVATSKHNVRYLLGGYSFIFFSAMDAIGRSRYLPALVYPRGGRDRAAYFANRMEGHEHAANPFWVPDVQARFWGSSDTMAAVAEHLGRLGLGGARVGIEPAFLPVDGFQALSAGLPHAGTVDASPLLARLRLVKAPWELDLLRQASESITDAMHATIQAAHEGTRKPEIIERLRQEETARGLAFEYCLLTLGRSHNRAASPQAWARGEVLSIDSGGNLQGYLGDICRMGCLGEPDAELVDLLAEVEAVQQAAFARIRPGATGAEVVAAAEAELRRLPNAAHNDFFAHGMGLTSHESPYLMTDHPVAYKGTDAGMPLPVGAVLSVETTMLHPTRGFIKIEDTVAVREGGHEMFGREHRGWTVGGA